MQKTDPVTLEVIRNALYTIAEEMGVGLQKSAYSSNIKTRLDFACAIFDSKVRNVVQALHIPSLLAALTNIVPSGVKEYDVENCRQGDVILINDPHKGGTHLPDVALISPVFCGSRLFGFVANIAHHQDIGGRAPGGVPADTSDIYQEGITIPSIKLVEEGKIREDILKLLLANVRAPWERAGDYRAQIAANKLGIKRVNELVEKYGVETLETCMEDLLNYAERRMRHALRGMPEGTYHAEDYMDSDGFSDKPVKVAAEVTIKGGEATVDLSGSDKQGPGPINSTLTPTLSAVSYVFKCLVDPDIPVNHGMYRPLKLIAPEGSVVNAKSPAAVAGCWEVAMRVTDVLVKALAEATPDRICAAGKGIICNISFGGVDPRNDRVYAFIETVGGGYGARPNKDGMEAVQYHLTNTQNAPIEELEISYPLMMERYELIPDSDGAGKFRGGLGIRRDYGFPDHPAVFSIVSDRAKFAPWGLNGGFEGRKSRYILNPDSPSAVELSSKSLIRVKPNDVVSIQTPGGGGYGDPRMRDRKMIREDLKNRKINLRRAIEVYGLTLEEAKEVMKA